MRLSECIHQKSYERVTRLVRRHFITLVPALVVFALLLTLPVGAAWLLRTVFPSLETSATLLPIIVLFGSGYYIAVLLFFYSYFLDFYLDLLVITNDRLIDMEQVGIFARHTAEVDLYKIQDITSEVKGVFASLFNYGDLLIQTAGAVERFVVEGVPRPDTLRQEILDLATGDRAYHQKTT
ncbi:MAG: PH domain-containing protein [Candidatus Magasanikbacteria bacterium]|nr:PH domain-containing protein [Candidatus Magasanikbacteria bacterium]